MRRNQIQSGGIRSNQEEPEEVTCKEASELLGGGVVDAPPWLLGGARGDPAVGLGARAKGEIGRGQLGSGKIVGARGSSWELHLGARAQLHVQDVGAQVRGEPVRQHLQPEGGGAFAHRRPSEVAERHLE